jgi:hypothetical protein
MPGELDPEYVVARRVLLDALEALREQLEAVVLVGAQAIYLRVGEGDLAVAPFTTDGDIALDPSAIVPDPLIEDALTDAGFVRDLTQPGVWLGTGDVTIDVMVPEAVAGRGSRSADLGIHGRRAARRAKGLEAVLVDSTFEPISSLESDDARVFNIRVAGAAALVVAKLHKIYERKGHPVRENAKDALDVLRLLRGSSTEVLAAGIALLLADERSAAVTQEALAYLGELFGSEDAHGSRLAAEAAAPSEDPDVIAQSCAALASDLLTTLGDMR